LQPDFVQRYALLAANEARGKDPKACAAAMLARLVIKLINCGIKI